MPKSAPSSFKGGGGVLRGVDGVIQAVGFEVYTPKDKTKQAVINGVLTVLPDGATEPIKSFGIFVGGAADFEIVNDGAGLDGEKEIGRNTEWYTLMASLAEALKAANIEEAEFFAQDEDSTVADYSCLVNQRVRFDWRANAKKTAKLGQRVSTKNPAQKFDREDLVITAYYGEVEPQPVVAKGNRAAPGAKVAKAATVVTKAAGGKPNGKAKDVDIAELATTKVVEALSAAKDGKMPKSKLSVKLLTGMAKEPEFRDEVREWAKDDNNLAGIDGVTFDPATQVLSLD